MPTATTNGIDLYYEIHGTGAPLVLINVRTPKPIDEEAVLSAARWFCNFTHEEVAELLAELHGQRQATIASEALIVR